MVYGVFVNGLYVVCQWSVGCLLMLYLCGLSMVCHGVLSMICCRVLSIVCHEVLSMVCHGVLSMVC